MRDMNKFENIDYFVEALGIQIVEAVSTPGDTGIGPNSERPKDEEEEGVPDFFGGGMPGMPEEPAGEDNSVRDWVLRRHMTLHTKEVNEKLRNQEPIVVVDPFADPVEDVTDPFYPGGLEGNPNTAPPENPEIVYDPAGEERAAEESQGPDEGDPSGEHSVNSNCYIPGTDQQSSYVEYDDSEPPAPIPSTRRSHTQAECAEIGGEWREVPMDVNPGDGGGDPWGDPGTPEGDP